MEETQKMLALMVGISEDLLEQLINATEDFDEPVSEEEIEEYEAYFNKAKKLLKGTK